MNTVAGVGKDEPIVVNENGGKQSRVLYRFDLLDPQSMFKMTEVLKQGVEKYGENENWRLISVRDHLNHLLIHAYAYLAGDTSDDHLSHIMCRAMFAQGVDLDMVKSPRTGPETDVESNHEIIRCAVCSDNNISVKKGIQFCSKCGTGHDISVTDGVYHINSCKTVEDQIRKCGL